MRISDWSSDVCSSDLRVMGANPAGLSMIRVDGDSMSPTLSHGDEIMVDRMDGAARLRDGIYVLRMDDTLMVKRVALGDRKSVGEGKSVSVRVGLGGRRMSKQKKDENEKNRVER